MSARRSRAGSIIGTARLALLYSIVWPIASLLAYLPVGLGLAVGRRLGDLLWVLLPGRRALTLANLERSFRSERSPAELRRLGRRSFEHLGMNLVESCCYFLRPTALMLARVRVDGLIHLQEAAARGSGILVLTAHYGNWELLAAAHGLTGLPLSFVVRPLDNPVLDELVDRFRLRTGAEMIAKRHALRGILEALRRGRMVGILLDQNATRSEGVFVPFFGVPASTSKALAVIALRTGAPVVPVFLRREPGGRHCMDVRPPVAPPAGGDVGTFTASFNRAIEEEIRLAPEQWFWMHARWRTRPREAAGDPRQASRSE
ncbi:MAG TPA: lysophospholipid acyltransferase family protein [Candidatus Bathyarchaeia archaeon]|nr:lysophospholipid acyltransferase family protein [Candidatus Bathyarchaeia archaeon]